MSIFGTLFGNKDKSTTIDENQLIYLLFKMRTLYRIKAMGYGDEKAQEITTEQLNKFNMSETPVQQLPETIITKIFHDYSSILTKNANDARSEGSEVDWVRGKILTIEHIEAHRNSLLRLSSVNGYPRIIDEYIYYRICREIPKLSGNTPEELGFTRDVVIKMVALSRTMYQQITPCQL